MAVAFFCNMNNHPFASVRYLRDAGIDAQLVLLNNESQHFHPSADTFGLEFQRYTHRVEWGDQYLLTATSKADIRRVASKYDFIVGCNTVPAHFHYAGVKLDLFCAHGSDIAEMPFFRLAAPRRSALSAPLWFPYHQRMGIAQTSVIAGPRVPFLEPLYDQCGFRGQRWFGTFPPLYARDFNAENIGRYQHCSNYFQHFKKVRDNHDLVIFHHARHMWVGADGKFANKGNDKLIRGFAEFRRRHRDVKAALILFEYGPDLSASMNLVNELGIEESCFWFPLMSRKELMLGVATCDIATGEFGTSWNFGGTILEGIAMAKPLMHYRDDSLYAKEELFPILNVNSADDVFQSLSRYVADPKPAQEVGRKAHEWFRRYIIDEPVQGFLDLLKERGIS
jgi:glycosyltransferase involved in cell wall biosynthesis